MPIEINEEGTSLEVRFEVEDGKEPEIGTIKTVACVHPGNVIDEMTCIYL